MGFRLSIKGQDNVELVEKNLETLYFTADTPHDSDARSTDLGATLTVTGKILTATDGQAVDDTIKLAKWSNVQAESADSYRDVTGSVIAAGQIVRQYSLPKAFVVDYTESFDDNEGVGHFSLTVKQKKDLLDTIKLDGGYDA
ncbi:MAG: membrane-associated protease 1 [Clostridiales Family XIII bacterium]|jgi:hypothetical protein|nr:membrane-associated protease 1 [Clostridiales Family XIII bacterium]